MTHVMYITCSGSAILSGWSSVRWGSCGKGPFAPTFQSLTKSEQKIAVDATFELFQQELLPKSLRQSGRLNKITITAGAAILMWYPQRHKKGTFPELLTKMRNVYGKQEIGSTTRSSTMNRVIHETLVRWGNSIKSRFDRDNIHLTTNYVVKGEKQLINSVVQVVRGLQHDINVLKKHQENSLVKIHELQLSIGHLHEMSLTKTSESFSGKRFHDVVESGHLSPGCITPTKKKPRMELVSTSKQEKNLNIKLSQFKNCESLYLSIKENKINLSSFSKQDRKRAKNVIDHYDSFCTSDELEVLLSSSSGDHVRKKKIVQNLTDLVKSIYRHSFTGSEKIPLSIQLGSKRQFKDSTLESLSIELKKQKKNIIPNSITFTKFRKDQVIDLDNDE